MEQLFWFDYLNYRIISIRFYGPLIETAKRMKIENVVIIIPTYNEALVIEDTLYQLFQAIMGIVGMDIHVLVFDSASTDETQTIVKQLQERNDHLHLKTEAQKTGLGAAYLQAMRFAMTTLSADIVIEFDADLSHQPQYIAPMLEKIRHHDVVMGSRYVKGGCIPKAWGLHRKLLSVLGNYIARLILTPKYKDFTSGFRATRRLILEKVLPQQFLSNHYAYKLELLWLLHKNKARICEHPIVFVDRQHGLSKLPTNSVIDSLRVIFILRLNALKSYFKMCLVGLSGAFVQALIYNILRNYLSPVTAMQIAVVLAIINNFILNNRFTFKRISVPGHKKIKAFCLFISYSVLIIMFQSSWLKLGLRYIGAGLLKENVIIFFGMVFGSMINYLAYSRLIWRDNPKESHIITSEKTISFLPPDNNKA